jgi:glycosyltransferase involved in cell wall biosynthesis
MYKLKFSILLTTYNGEETVGDTIRSLLSQSFGNFEIIVSDNASSDNTENIVKSFNDPRIFFFRNEINLGYPGNLEKARTRARGDIIYLIGQDDILGCDALLNTYKAFNISEDIGAVTRPYYWFHNDINVPVRAKDQLNPNKNEIVSITDEPERIISVFKTLDQLSGLAYRVKYMDIPFHPDCFPCHIYPFASIFKKYPVVFLKDYNVAVRISSSMSRTTSSVYEKSPMQSWVEMFDSVYREPEFQEIKNKCIKNFVAVNYVGLIQLRNYAKYKYFLREIWFLLKYRWQNIFSPQFWFFSLGCVVIPPFVLIPFVDWYKNKLNSMRFKKISFSYKI